MKLNKEQKGEIEYLFETGFRPARIVRHPQYNHIYFFHQMMLINEINICIMKKQRKEGEKRKKIKMRGRGKKQRRRDTSKYTSGPPTSQS